MRYESMHNHLPVSLVENLPRNTQVLYGLALYSNIEPPKVDNELDVWLSLKEQKEQQEKVE
jgi:hypothetical protein